MNTYLLLHLMRDPSGPAVRRPVILPPLEAGSIRCSVKPASRHACHSRNRGAPELSPKPRRPTTQLGTGGPICSTADPGPQPYRNVHTTLMPPLGLQARAAELGESKGRNPAIYAAMRIGRRGAALLPGPGTCPHTPSRTRAPTYVRCGASAGAYVLDVVHPVAATIVAGGSASPVIAASGSAHVEAGSRACRRIRAGESCRWPSARARHQMSAWDGRGEPPPASHSSPPPDPRGRAKGAAAFAVDRATCRPSHGHQRRI
uniref:Uncharacterized protein n=1 Tax=Oryza nivara TaxID=4536 RepID=A0A0E0HU17_ORYNI